MSGPSYHDVYVTTEDIPRTRLADLPFRVRLEASRVGGWRLWASQEHIDYAIFPEEVLGEEYGKGLRIDIAGHVICDSLSPTASGTGEGEPGRSGL